MNKWIHEWKKERKSIFPAGFRVDLTLNCVVLLPAWCERVGLPSALRHLWLLLIAAGALSWFLPQWPLGASSFIPQNVSISPSWELHPHPRKCAHMLEVRHCLCRNQILEAAEPLEICILCYFYNSDYFLKIVLGVVLNLSLWTTQRIGFHVCYVKN